MNVVGKVRSSNGFMRTVASIVLVAFTTVTVSPSVQAMQQFAGQQAMQAQLAAQERDSLGRNLLRAKERLRVLATETSARTSNTVTVEQKRNARDELRAWRDEYRDIKARVRADFEATAALLKDKQAAPVILERQAQAQAQFEAESAVLEQDLDAAIDASNDAETTRRARAAFDRLEGTQLKRAQQPFDPRNLPNSALRSDQERKPKLTAEAFQAALLTAEPAIRFAQSSGFDFSQLPGANNPSYLEASTEVVLSAEIQAKANELNHDPVAIYNWVRNNVQWQPTWGAIQDASHTLAAGRGNAFDIASLTIALLRASGIPARYVHGTIELSEAQFRNWTGGFQSIDAAIDFASAGGIPITAVTSGGRITKVRLEHIWLEAAIDFAPSRGARNRVADSWVAIDPSFKQVEILSGLDVVQITGLDPQSLAEEYLASGATNQGEGWATGFNPAVLSGAQSQAKSALEDYIRENLPNATTGDILGGRRIVAVTTPVLPGMPNRIVVTGARYAQIPQSLQQQITFAFGNDIEGEPIEPRTFPWAQLNNRQVALSFRPATAADESALRALLPAGPITDLSQLPASVPAYLIRVVPELTVDDAVVMSGAAVTLGADVNFVFNARFVGAGTKPFSYKVPAGSYLSVAVAAGSINPAIVAATRARLEATQAAIERNNPAELATIGRGRLFGDVFASGLLMYYSQYVSLGYVAGLRDGGHHHLAAGLGTYGYEPAVDYLFGLPKRIHGGAAAMNIPIVNIVGQDGTAAARSLTMRLGALSSMLEHSVPEQMFTPNEPSGEGISAVKALSKAQASGQRIYTITASNQAAVLPQIHHDPATLAEISNALAVGRTVITHTDAVTVPGWTGAGYVIMDADTGAAAWKISGGSNGGFFTGVALGVGTTALLTALALIGPAGMVGLWVFLGIVFSMILLYVAIEQALDVYDTEETRDCLATGATIGAALTGLLVAYAEGQIFEAILAAIGISILDVLIGQVLEDVYGCFRE